MDQQPRSSPGPAHRDQSPSLSRNFNRLSLSRAQSPGDRRSSPMTSTFRSTTPGVYDPRVRRASSSASQAGTPPRNARKSSVSSLRNMANPSSPSGSPRSSVVELPPITAESVASEYYAQQLALHDSATTQVAVILHDACYGHRFSRPKTTKGMLSMIVERPERIRAAVLGLSAAYVRLSKESVPFKIRKSSRSVPLTSPFVAAVHGTAWMQELEAMCNVAAERLALHMKELARHDPSKDPFHEGDLYLCSESLNALQGAIGGVCDAVDTVFSNIPTSPRRAFVAIRPPGHHCSSDFPSGFCWINNVHIGIEYAAQTYGLTHAVILDIDLHHGDGSQDVTWERNAKSAKMPKNASFTKKTAIGYYSMHDINSYPCEDGDKDKVQNASLCIDDAHGQSIWNVHLEAWKTLDEFWALYETKYSILLEMARRFLKRHTKMIKASPKQAPPKAAIFISAGFDASQWEGAGMQRHAVNVPTEFYARFAKDVVKLAHEEGTGVNGRVISVLEGGYSDRALCSGVLSHVSGLCQDSHLSPISQPGHPEDKTSLQDTHPTPQTIPQIKPEDDADDISKALQSMNISAPSTNGSPHVPEYDSDWWDVRNLEALENHVTPRPAPVTKSQRNALPTYATPTQSFTGKVVDPIKFQRTVSGTMRPMSPRPTGPVEPPEVTWIVATHELSKLIIPSDRQTRSHAPEELAPQRVKKDRLSGPAAISVEPSSRQLRTRNAPTPQTTSPPAEMNTAGQSVLQDVPAAANGAIQVPKRMTRRTSAMFNLEPEVTDMPPVPSLPKQAPAAKARKPRATASKPTSPVKASSKPVLDPAIKLENVQTRPEPKRYDSEPSVPSAVPLTNIDYTRPINHIEPLKPAGIRRIHLKVGTREEHDRKQKEREDSELQAKVEAKPKSRIAAATKQSKTAMSEAPSVQQSAGAARTPELQPTIPTQAVAEPTTTTQQTNPTIPSHMTDDQSPLLLDLERSRVAEAEHQAAETATLPTEQQSAPLAAAEPQQPQTIQSHQLEHQASADPAQVPLTSQPPIISNPPSTSTAQPSNPPPNQQQYPNPTYAQPRNNLPIFSSTGAIPFAPPRPSGPTPIAASGHGNGVSRSMLNDLPVISKQVTPEQNRYVDVDMDMDMDWDDEGQGTASKEGEGRERVVPETPQH